VPTDVYGLSSEAFVLIFEHLLELVECDMLKGALMAYAGGCVCSSACGPKCTLSAP
jgi:hypothetical protein